MKPDARRVHDLLQRIQAKIPTYDFLLHGSGPSTLFIGGKTKFSFWGAFESAAKAMNATQEEMAGAIDAIERACGGTCDIQGRLQDPEVEMRCPIQLTFEVAHRVFDSHIAEAGPAPRVFPNFLRGAA